MPVVRVEDEPHASVIECDRWRERKDGDCDEVMLGGTPALWNGITLRDVTVVTYLFYHATKCVAYWLH